MPITLKSAYLLDTTKYDELFGTKKEEASHREATASNIDATPTTSENVPYTKSSSTSNISRKEGNVNYDTPIQENETTTPTYESLEEQSINNEPLAVEDVKKVTGFGDRGAELVTNIANTEGTTFSQAEKAVKTAYFTGFNHPDLDIKKVDFGTKTQSNAFTAGQIDSIAQENTFKDRAKNVKVFGAESGLAENELSKKLDPAAQEVMDVIGKDFQIPVEVKDRILAGVVDGEKVWANAAYNGSKITVSQTAKIVHGATIHEGTHRMAELDPDAFAELAEFVFETVDQTSRRAELGFAFGYNFDKIKDKYTKGGVILDTRGYREEMVAHFYEAQFKNPEAFLEWRNQLELNPKAKAGWEKLLDIIKKVFEELKAVITNSKMSLDAKKQAQKELDAFEKAYVSAMKSAEQKAKAYLATKDAVAERTTEVRGNTNSTKNLEIKINEEYNGNISYSLHAYPKLNKSEWALLNNRLEIELRNNNNFIDDYTKWLYATNKNTRVFAIYGIGWGDDATPLYAVGGKKAETAYNKMLKFMEGLDEEFDGSRENFEGWLNSYTSNKGATGNNISNDGNRGTSAENGSIHSEQQASNRKRTNNGSRENSENVKFSLQDNENTFGKEENYNEMRNEKYTEKQYKDYGWARDNEILTAGHNADYHSKFAMAKSGQAKFPKIKNGEYIIAVSNIYDRNAEGIDDVLVFAKGTITNPVITRVIEIYASDETSIDKIRRRIYELERRGIQQKDGDLFRRYDAADFGMQYERYILQVGRYSDGDRLGGRSGEEASATAEGADVNYSLDEDYDIKLSAKNTSDLLDAVEDVQKGKKGASQRLAKYVEGGVITTEAYEELIEKYGTIPYGENPHREVRVPKKTAKDKKVSQTVRTILEAKATPDEALPTIEKMVVDGVFSYDVYTDKQSINDAETYIKILKSKPSVQYRLEQTA